MVIKVSINHNVLLISNSVYSFLTSSATTSFIRYSISFMYRNLFLVFDFVIVGYLSLQLWTFCLYYHRHIPFRSLIDCIEFASVIFFMVPAVKSHFSSLDIKVLLSYGHVVF